MMHKAWSSIEEVPYCFSRSYVKLQGHTAKKNRQILRKFPESDHRTISLSIMAACIVANSRNRPPVEWEPYAKYIWSHEGLNNRMNRCNEWQEFRVIPAFLHRFSSRAVRCWHCCEKIWQTTVTSRRHVNVHLNKTNGSIKLIKRGRHGTMRNVDARGHSQCMLQKCTEDISQSISATVATCGEY